MKTKSRCNECNKYLEEKINQRMYSRFTQSCYRCESKHLKLGGKYNTINKGIKQRWICCHCSLNFIKKGISYRKQVSDIIIKKILRYSIKHKGYFNKFDNSKKTTYTTRELADMFDISKSGVWNLLKTMKTK